jgi:hypothetical protein
MIFFGSGLKIHEKSKQTTGTHKLCVPVQVVQKGATGTTSTVQGLSPQLRGLSRISNLYHNALKPGTIAVNPFVIGCGNRGGKPDNFSQNHK